MIADLAEQFILVRVTNMRGVDLNVFDFDYDLTWAAFFLGPDEKIYGRYGGRDADSPDTFLSLDGLRFALQAALAAHRAEGKRDQAPAQPPRTVEQFAAAGRLPPRACVHCHQVYDFRREERQAASVWKLDELWVYPLPENVGLTLDVKQGNRVQTVVTGSAAERAGLRTGDVLQRLGTNRTSAIADVQYSLHHAPAQGTLTVEWLRAGRRLRGELALPDGWRKTDISWRPSTRGLEPPPCVHGEDLTAAEKQALGLSAQRLAFRQGNFVPRPAQQAGIRQNDIILGLDGKELELTERQFRVWIRLHYRVGGRVTWNLLRDGRRLDLPMTLPSRAPF